MNFRTTFTNFTPTLLPLEEYLGSLKNSYQETGLLVCGELHGVRQNADALYSIVRLLGCDTLAIERTHDQVGAFIDSALRGEGDINLVDPNNFTSSAFSVEMAKTIQVMISEGLIKNIIYIDGTDENDNEIEETLAQNLINASQNTIAFMGNWHTTRNPIKVGAEGHISALMRLRKTRKATSLEYEYGSGTFYNQNTSLDTLNSDIGKLEIKGSGDDFSLCLPRVDAIAHR